MARILHIDDDPLFAEITEPVFVNHGDNQVFYADSAQNAEKTLEEFHKAGKDFDVIISDNNLGRGEMSGVELAAKIHAAGSNVPVIMLSGDEWDTIGKTAGQTHPEVGKTIAAFVSKIDGNWPEKILKLIAQFTQREKSHSASLNHGGR